MSPCPELEQLFEAVEAHDADVLRHLAGCTACSAVVEEHRQLEKDLFRLSDPLPPRDFVAQVMARVEAEPAPARAELKAGLFILTAAVALAVASFALGHGRPGAVGASFAGALVSLHAVLGSLLQALSATWHTAAGPLAVALTGMLLVTLLGLKKLSPQPAPAGLERVKA